MPNIISGSLVKQNNIAVLKCYSAQLSTPAYSTQLQCLPKPITLKNALSPSSSQV